MNCNLLRAGVNEAINKKNQSTTTKKMEALFFWSSTKKNNEMNHPTRSNASGKQCARKMLTSAPTHCRLQLKMLPSARAVSYFLLVTFISISSTIPQATATASTEAVEADVISTTIPSTIGSNGTADAAATTEFSTTTLSPRLKGGRCPKPGMDTRLCRDQTDQCTNDKDCGGESLCCHTGCNTVCILPVFTACEQVRSSAERRARSLDAESAQQVQIAECDETGGFREVQCDPGQETCYCVDQQGFELPGTRAAGGREMVNCSNPRPCLGPMCRMLCPYGFQLDKNGCEVCECRNVCKGVKCPGDTQCEIEEVPCSVDPCPPIPSCKQPRTLDSLCTFGAPLLIPETGNPFLCGKGPGQPTCPAAFDCNVKTGDDYGVCCASNKNFEKPGSCPVVASTTKDNPDKSAEGRADEDDPSCQTSCRHDLDCSEMDKCCFTERCGKSCMKPANSTICRQQRHIAELLSQKEIDGRGYIPQCDENGNFVPRQCSRNGKICWCVSPEDGKNYPQSLGPADAVNCSNIHQRQRAVISSRMEHCDHVICAGTCDYGFKTDNEGCPTCDCIKNPCDLMKCPSGSVCEMMKDTSCSSDNDEDCMLKATCLSDSLYVNPCTMGTPLTQVGTQKVVTCSEAANTCPSSHICVMVSPNKAGLCCVNKPRIEPTKEGMCPFIAPSVCNSSTAIGLDYKGCTSDNDCEHSMKCCSAGTDCTVCADPLFKEDLRKANKMVTMCQYISESVDKVGGVFSKFRLAVPRPQCKENGQFEEIQCDEKNCMCVDENGADIPGTLIPKAENNLTRDACIEARVNPKCLEMNCRLGCDYGYEMLDGCKICECRNPCNSVNTHCTNAEQCEMVDIDCWDGTCPSLPFCVPESLANGADLRGVCPKGTAFVLESNNETLTCNPRARMLQCPDDFYCHDIEDAHDFGVCCPIPDDDDLIPLTADERHGSQEDGMISTDDDLLLHDVDHDLVDDDIDNEGSQGILLFHDGNHVFVEGNNALGRSDDSHQGIKMGQCPYLVPSSAGSCESQCGSDTDCEDERKCCVNSCGGTHCTQPLLHTACQHQKNIIEHIARENGIPAKRFFIPECDDNGEYLKIQSFGKFHWCVDSAGHEIQGTRVPSAKRPNCQHPSVCPLNPCALQCEFGYQLDISGCPVCQCKQSPCEDITCDRGEECRMMQLSCISEPCPPVPLCLPKLENPCPFGEPLRYMDSHDRVTCGPGGSSCPSSHKCHISPFGEYAVCCPKPKEVCFEKPDFRGCNAMAIQVAEYVTEKWFFNSSSNECHILNYNPGCLTSAGGNSRGFYYANLFDTKSECLSVCPSLTHCERTREKNMEMRERYQHFNYVPNCDPQTGEWDPTQCFDEVGMCWCVNKKGEAIKGSMTNGMPKCQARRGRLLGASSTVEPLVCEKGITVHRCNVSLCEGKVCLSNPSARCFINPCGGCQERWITEDGETVDCNEGLTKCQQEMQRVVNSQSQRSTMIAVDAMGIDGDSSGEDIIITGAKSPFTNLDNALTEIFLTGGGKPHLNYHPEEVAMADPRTQMAPIYGNFGDHDIVGLTTGPLAYMGSPATAPSPKSSSSEEKDLNVLLGTTRKHSTGSRATSIADILADMMRTSETSTELGTQDASSLTSSDFIDLMPSSSQMAYGPQSQASRTGRMLPAPMAFSMAYSYHQHSHPQLIPLSRVRRDSATAAQKSSAAEGLSQEENLSEESSRNPEILVSIIPRRKPGSCPPPSHMGILNLISGACRDDCEHDNDCGTALKCCVSQCGFKCMEAHPNIMQTTSADHMVGLGIGGDHIMPTSAAMDNYGYLQEDDYDDDFIEPAKMIPVIPQCNALDNEYSPVQSQGELSWCVTAEGIPLHETLTRGKIQCDRNGTIMYRQAMGPVCPDPTIKPMVCTDQCLHTTCTLHPEAVCVMDVCDNCKPTYFRSSSGEKVECEEKCSQPPADPGYCRAYITRYTFNSTANQCEKFIFGGCHGNDNNFKTLEECQQECEQPAPVCELPVKVGPCRASKTRWFFNAETQACESFWYSGCGGNANNFATKEQCESRCPDMILCPFLVDGEMKECSRTKACQNVTCINSMNSDEYVCHVDPCTCKAKLEDVSGAEISCPVQVEVEVENEVPTTTTQGAPIVTEQYTEAPPETTTTFIEYSTIEPEITQTQEDGAASQLSLQVLMDMETPLRSKCMSMSQVTRVKCDSEGQFLPIQCPFTNSNCHCVDEAGNYVESSPVFTLGSQTCEPVPLEKIDVTLNFPFAAESEPGSVRIGVETQDLLRKLHAELLEDKVEVEVLPSSTVLRFTLVGNKKVDISYKLEEMVAKNAIGIMENDHFIPVNSAMSKFTPVQEEMPLVPTSSEASVSVPDFFDEKRNNIRPILNTNELDEGFEDDDIFEDVSVSAESLAVDAEYNVVAVLLTVVVVMSVFLAGFGMCLALQKKKHTGSYPKKPFDSLAFTSQIYDFDTTTKKVPLDLPTFKVTPPATPPPSPPTDNEKAGDQASATKEYK